MARDRGWLQQPLARALSPVMSRAWDIELTGADNVPKSGPALITPNHISFLDSMITMWAMPRRTFAVGKAEYMDSWKTRYFFPACGMIPLDRSGGAASQAALDLAAAYLDQGELFLIYPEGTRTRDGYLHKGRTGAARLALRTGAPLIPVGIRGTDNIQPPDKTMPKWGESCEYHIGKPIDVSRYRDKADDRLLLRQITDEVMFEIAELSGQTYVDAYSGEEAPVPMQSAAAVDEPEPLKTAV